MRVLQKVHGKLKGFFLNKPLSNHFYLKVRISRQRKTEDHLLLCSPVATMAMAMAELVQSWKSGGWFLMWMQGHKDLGHPAVLSQGAGLDLKHLGPDPAPI